MLSALGLLLIAIFSEVTATAAMPRTDGFRDLGWTAFVLVGYGVSFWLLSLVVRHMPVSVAYAIWSGVGTATIAVIGVVFLGEGWDLVKVLAIALIVLGVVVLNVHHAH
ncbi:MAG: DMT family transporter [Nocardioidaceae bacterium]